MTSRKRHARRGASPVRRDAAITRNRAVGLAAERQYKFIETLKGSQVARTGRGSDFQVKGLFAARPRLVEVKTGHADLSPLQRRSGAEVVRPNPFLNSAVATGVGFAGGVAVAEAVKRLIKDRIHLTCDACGTEAALDIHFCPLCSSPLSRKIELWIGLGLAAVGAIILVLDILTHGLNLPLDLMAGGLLGAGIDLVLDSVRANFSQPSPTTGMATG